MKNRTSTISGRNSSNRPPITAAVAAVAKSERQAEAILRRAEKAAQDELESIEWVRCVTNGYKTVGVGFDEGRLVFVRKDGYGEKPDTESCTLPEACEMLERIIRSEMLFGGDIEVSDEGFTKFLRLVSKSVS